MQDLETTSVTQEEKIAALQERLGDSMRTEQFRTLVQSQQKIAQFENSILTLLQRNHAVYWYVLPI